jgi:hypothetical protein
MIFCNSIFEPGDGLEAVIDRFMLDIAIRIRTCRCHSAFASLVDSDARKLLRFNGRL